MLGGAIFDGDEGGEKEVGLLDFLGVTLGLDDDVGRSLATDMEPNVVAFGDAVGEVIVAR